MQIRSVGEKCNASFKYETKPVGGGKWLFEWVSHLVIQQIHSNGWFIQRRGKWLLSLWMGYWIIDSLDSFKNVDSFQ